MRGTKLRTFEYRLFRRLREWNLEGERVLVACSGGMDSVALAHALAKVAPRLGFEIEIGHVHHGASSSKKVRGYRAQAGKRAKALAEDLGLEFHLARVRLEGGKELLSEEALRDHRLKSLAAIQKKARCSRVAFAHHADDLFETRLIRLVRGTGAQGLLAMSERSDRVMRPFLKDSRSDIEAYARECGLEWCEDPSNAETGPLRNWIRNSWIPELEKKRPGSARAFARSLATIVETLGAIDPVNNDEKMSRDRGEIDRSSYLQLGIAERRRALACILNHLGARGFSNAHIEEIRKRIESPKRIQRFRLLKFEWDINAEQILVRRSAKSSQII